MRLKKKGIAIFDVFIKSSNAALRFILSHCGVQNSTPLFFGFARLACNHFMSTSED